MHNCLHPPRIGILTYLYKVVFDMAKGYPGSIPSAKAE